MPIENASHSPLIHAAARERFHGLDHFSYDEFVEYLNKLVIPDRLQDLFDLLDTIKKYRFSNLLYLGRVFITYQLAHGQFTPHVKHQFENIEDKDFPVHIDSSYPKPIADVLELLNAMWHGEQALEFLETKEIGNRIINHTYNMVFSRHGFEPLYLVLQKLGKMLGLWKDENNIPNLPENQVLLKIYYEVANHIYKAFWSLTHINVKNTLNLVFAEELKEYFIPLTQYFIQKFGSYKDKSIDFILNEKYLEFAYTSGKITGIVVDQLKPHTGKIDLQYIDYFTKSLPSYIKQLNDYLDSLIDQDYKPEESKNKASKTTLVDSLEVCIKDVAKTFADQQPFADPQKLEEFEQNAIQLLRSLEKIQNGIPLLNVIHYIKVINHTVKIVKQLVGEIGKAKKSTQDVIKSYLAQLKYKFIPNLLSFMDKVEKTGLIATGTITDPLFAKLDELYSRLIKICKNIVDFDDDSLLYLADVKFMDLRLRPLYKFISNNIQNVIINSEVKSSYERFFNILHKHQDKKYFNNLPRELRLQLNNHLKRLKALFCELDMPVFSQMVRSLTNQNSERIEILRILELEEKFKLLLEQKFVTSEFDTNLCEDIINNSYEKTEINILPWQKVAYTNSSFADSSSPTFTPKTFFADSLSEYDDFNHVEEIENLRTDSIQIQEGNKAIEELIFLLRNYDNNEAKIKRLYAKVQPLIEHLNINDEINIADNAIVAFINKNIANEHTENDIVLFLSHLHSLFEKKIDELNVQIESHAHWSMHSFYMLPLELPEEDARAYHVFKTQEYSDTLSKTQTSLKKFFTIFNSYLQPSLLRANYNDVPFPEIRDLDTRLREPVQVSTIKNLSNLIYQIYKGTVRLEALRDDDDKTHYVWNVMKAFAHLNQALNCIKILANDVMLQQLLREVTQNLQNLQAIVLNEYALYRDEDVTEKMALNFVLSVLKILPKRIEALHNEEDFDLQISIKGKERARKMTKTIEEMVKASSSYFRLFLTAPKIYMLFVELRKAVKDLANVTNTAVKERLWDIKNNILGEMQYLADYYEYSLGLKAGFLSNPLSLICFEYFAGLIKPLGLDSQEYFELAVGSSVYNERYRRIIEAQAVESLNQWKLEQKAENIYRFLNLISHFKSKRSLWNKIVEWGTFIHNPVITEDQNNHRDPFDDLNSAYEKIVDMLHANDDFDIKNFYQHHFDISIEDIIRETDPSKKLKFLERFAQLYASYYEGMNNTSYATIKSLEEKREHLKLERQYEISRRKSFIREHIKEIVTNEVNLYAKEFMKDFIHLPFEKERYKQELFTYIEENVEAIIEDVRNDADINLSVSRIIHELVKDFFNLVKIRLAISELDTFLERHSLDNYLNQLHEDITTLQNKVNAVTQLKIIAFDDSKSIKECLRDIDKFLRESDFEQTMLAERYNVPGFFQQIVRLVFKLFELLGFYTPEHKKYYRSFKNNITVNEIPKPNATRFSMFAPKSEDELEEELFSLPSENSSITEDNYSAGAYGFL